MASDERANRGMGMSPKVRREAGAPQGWRRGLVDPGRNVPFWRRRRRKCSGAPTLLLTDRALLLHYPP
jgi:hypothetical protein